MDTVSDPLRGCGPRWEHSRDAAILTSCPSLRLAARDRAMISVLLISRQTVGAFSGHVHDGTDGELRGNCSFAFVSDLAFRSLSLASLCNFELGAHFGRRTVGRIR